MFRIQNNKTQSLPDRLGRQNSNSVYTGVHKSRGGGSTKGLLEERAFEDRMTEKPLYRK